jgi:hypothetical protein
MPHQVRNKIPETKMMFRHAHTHSCILQNVSLFVPSDSSLPLPGQEEGIDFTLINAL